MDKKPLPIGIDDFEKLITREYFFIDKTLLIKDLIDNKSDVNLFTRPRRFGKTLNISMLQHFFEDRRNIHNGSKIDNSYLFEGLNINECGEKYTSHMGQYPVINLSLKSGKQPNFEMAYESLIGEILKEYERHRIILQGNELSEIEKETYLRIVGRKGSDTDYAKSIEFLSNCLYKCYDKKVIVLIDEYDVPLENSFFEGFYDEMVKFIRSLFESSLKTNTSLEFAVITGCLRISKESIFTGLNNLKIISILDESYAEHFGFTDNEVMKACEYYDLESKYETIKQWYDGYIFGETNVYNPWSVVQYLFDLKANINKLPSPYWANTSSNSIVKSLIEKADDETKAEIEALIEGKTIEKIVHEDITYDEVYDSLENLWNFMFFTGYFKKISERLDEEDNRVIKLAIPNREVKYIFRRKVLKWFREKIKLCDMTKLFDAVVNREPLIFEEELGKLLIETISFNDLYENFYHGFIAGVLSNLKGYIVKSNREGGSGRSDLFVKTVSKRGLGIVIEFKIAKDIDDLEEKADEAIKQIEEKGYDMELRSEGYKNIIKYGIAFYQKDCLVKIKE